MSGPAVPTPPRASAGVPGPYRPSGPPVPAEPRVGTGSGHPAVDAAIEGVINASGLAPADQIAQYEAAHRTLQETLATIDQA